MLARRFPRSVASLPALVAFVREFFAAHRLDVEEAFGVDLVVEELFTNMVRHARGGGPEIELALEEEEGLVTVRLCDEGAEPWNPEEAPLPRLNRAPEERRPGGLGLHLVRRLTRDLHFEHDRGVTVVTALMEIGH